MRRRPPAVLLGLAGLLALYLCAPFAASIQQVAAADWHGVDVPALGSAIGVSVASAGIATVLIAIGGIPLGYCLSRSSSPWGAWLGFVVQLPLALPPLTSGVLLLFLFGPYSPVGIWTQGALTDSFSGVVLAEAFVAAPFLIVAARSAFAAVDPGLNDLAATLGHHAWSRFLRVDLPLAWPGIRAGLALAWLRAFGEFGATMMVAYHPYSLPVYTYVAFGSQGLPAMMPLLLPTLAIAVLMSALAARQYRRRRADILPDDAEPCAVPPPVGAVPHRVRTGGLEFAFRKRLGTFQLDVGWSTSVRRLAILGASGSGKSLTLRLLAGLERAESGALRLDDQVLDAVAPEQRGLAYVPQDYGLFSHLTVSEHLAFPTRADPAAARYWAHRLGIEALLARRPAELSLGQAQRVAIARALSCPSRLLLLDEPFAALDTPRRRQLCRQLRQLQREVDVTTVLVTHDPDEAAWLADEILVLDGGRVLQAGRSEALFARPASLRVAELLGLPNVGCGVADAEGELHLAADVVVPIASAAASGGGEWMWSIDPGALIFHAQGRFCALLDSIVLRHGEARAVVNLSGLQLDVPVAGRNWRAGDACRLDIPAAALQVWRPGLPAVASIAAALSATAAHACPFPAAPAAN
ncbi:ATP-binding cassette domain-containing protein [Paludibacterium yongneupense]|uniref:ABC transporter ATP-binding protein/permease n=1 Tax=Paludibacterium yongneupense TaxID=400061 RepID=UPI0003FDB81F|nr:ATP-binding cassette domain-containing protein [Paludibacterium yongneupense]